MKGSHGKGIKTEPDVLSNRGVRGYGIRLRDHKRSPRFPRSPRPPSVRWDPLMWIQGTLPSQFWFCNPGLQGYNVCNIFLLFVGMHDRSMRKNVYRVPCCIRLARTEQHWKMALMTGCPRIRTRPTGASSPAVS